MTVNTSSRQPHSILHTLLNQLPTVKRFFVAYSGGLDSHVLLHRLQQEIVNFPDIALTAIHINHQLNVNANQWQQHCQQICRELNIPLQIITLNFKLQRGESLEEIARQHRYDAFSKLMQETDCLLTAHHQDDQAETLLLQLLRGAGPKGLSAMPSLCEFKTGFHARPFLDNKRSDLENYAQLNKLQWVDDDSNQQQTFDRNYLRHQIMPQIKQRWPAATQSVSRSARLCAESEELVGTLINQDLAVIKQANDTLSITVLRQFARPRQAQIIRYWLSQRQLTTPSEKKLLQILDGAINSRPDANPHIKWQGGEVRRFRDELYAFRELNFPHENATHHWDLNQSVIMTIHGGKLLAKKTVGINLVLVEKNNLHVRFNVQGLKCKIAGRAGTKSLKKLFQEWNVPVWQRKTIPLLFEGEQLIAIVGYAVCAPCTVQSDQLGWEIKFERCHSREGGNDKHVIASIQNKEKNGRFLTTRQPIKFR